jgi:hypothetical protein
MVVGMMVALIVREDKVYHGPNAKKVCKKVYKNRITGKCIKLGVRIV